MNGPAVTEPAPGLASLAQGAAARLKARGETLSVAESSTGGLLSAALLAVPGASSYFVGGGVVYTNASRKVVLHMTRDDVKGLAPLTPPMAAIFAERTRERFATTWAIAELGAAGPTGTRYGAGPGTSAIAIAGPVAVSALIETGLNDREANMWAFTRHALRLLEQALA